ncbi:hypothetical protein FKP32DRAFT_1590258 [Trametes sanguinea]|nr:hypothetical protein FKP32DRAFT_1590258 [Trametes sanguinea]
MAPICDVKHCLSEIQAARKPMRDEVASVYSTSPLHPHPPASFRLAGEPLMQININCIEISS